MKSHSMSTRLAEPKVARSWHVETLPRLGLHRSQNGAWSATLFTKSCRSEAARAAVRLHQPSMMLLSLSIFAKDVLSSAGRAERQR